MTDTTIEILDPVAEAQKGMRLLRDAALAQTDYMVLPDAKLPAGITAAQVIAYRQYLRDLPKGATKDAFMTFKGCLSLTDWVATQTTTTA